jgi:D-glycero-alpha-D-manno-heptose-7-phosphate kinase
MIITRTPFRVSLFGGGSDLPEWYRFSRGSVLSFSIDKYCYISIRELPPFFSHKYRVVYSQVEEVIDVDQIKHPAVKEILKRSNFQFGVELHHHGDLPARSGVGSSSAFAVGLLHATSILCGMECTKDSLAREAIHLEQDALSELVGSQDQIACAYGGLNRIDFGPGDHWSINSLNSNERLISEIQERAVLVFSGISRYSSEVSKGIFDNFQSKRRILERTANLVNESLSVIDTKQDLDYWGELLQESWLLKEQLNDASVTPELNNFKEEAKKHGAIGWKILGAGGGGFFLFWLRKNDRERFLRDFKIGVKVPFKIDFEGTKFLNPPQRADLG